ncbi:hypothetical protein BTO06_16565 [Tenacibaculum sp. SZ-18]|uniref:hypothetical protein n=1 Tax=Tenacibaculum sp. SZ-18 TaxID=754423 RepID=UPI000C2D2075|nr:hypothetical protein [Tenacibaculum sp. SZ-18]AUC16661.1 hypothetical protein BTO06_16565 [Tenacibaculum sp. SZ-18]
MKIGISVNRALLIGHVIVNLPVLCFILGTPLLTYYFFSLNIVPIWSIPISIIAGFGLAWFIWSFMITKWRIWAFENVRNVHDLKKRAIEEKLLWEDGNWFEKTEIRSKQDKIDLERTFRKFEKEDQFREDYLLPKKTKIYYSRCSNPIEIVSTILIFLLAFYFILYKNDDIKYVIGALLTLIIVFRDFLKTWKKITSNEPIIEIDASGVTTEKSGFKKWSQIEGEDVIKEYFKESKLEVYLVYYYDQENEVKINLKELNVNYKEMINILKTYRIRNNKNRG